MNVCMHSGGSQDRIMFWNLKDEKVLRVQAEFQLEQAQKAEESVSPKSGLT